MVEKQGSNGLWQKSGFWWKNGDFKGPMVENRGFSGKMGVLMGVWSKIGGLVENTGFLEK